MEASYEEIKAWLQNGKKQGATHLIVVCDTFEWEDYPVYVKPDENVHLVEYQYSEKNMQRVMEVYNLSKDLNTQLKQHRSFNY